MKKLKIATKQPMLLLSKLLEKIMYVLENITTQPKNNMVKKTMNKSL